MSASGQSVGVGLGAVGAPLDGVGGAAVHDRGHVGEHGVVGLSGYLESTWMAGSV